MSQSVATTNRFPKYDKGRVKILIPLQRDKHEAGLLRSLYYQATLKTGLFSIINPICYLLISDRYFNILSAKPGHKLTLYRPGSVLYNSVFNMNKIDSFDLEKSFGLSLKKIQRATQGQNLENPKVHMIRVEPKSEIIDSLSPQCFLEFRFLVSQLMARRKALVLPSLEKWLDIDQEDIKKINIDKSQRTGDLNHEHYLRLFMYIRKLPNYRGSVFMQAAMQSDENF